MNRFEAQDGDFAASVRRSFEALTLMRTLGARLLSVAPGDVEIELPFRDDLTQHHGFLAGAVVTAIVDVACGYAAMTLMPAGASVLTVEYKVNFLSPARGQRLLARGRVVRPGRTVTVCAGDVVALIDGAEKPVATMLATMATVSPSAGDSRPAVTAHDQRSTPPHAVGPARRSHRWCVCGSALDERAGGRGLRRRLAEIVRPG
jgi:uncharacterized protein (TIGR00369 family)